MLIITGIPMVLGDQEEITILFRGFILPLCMDNSMTKSNRKVKSAIVADLEGLASQTGNDSNRISFSTIGDLVECRVLPSTRKHGEKAPAKEGFHLPASATEDVLSRSLIPDFEYLQNDSRLQQKIRTINRRKKAKHETWKRSQNIEREN